MENLSNNKKISLVLGAVLIMSLFMPWMDYFIFSVSLVGIPGTIADLSAFGGMDDIPFRMQLAIYMGYAFLIFGAAGLFFNYKGDIQKSKLSYYAMIGYFVLVLLINISDMTDGLGDKEGGGPSIFDILGIGFYIFIASFIGNLKYLKEEIEEPEEKDPEVIE